MRRKSCEHDEYPTVTLPAYSTFENDLTSEGYQLVEDVEPVGSEILELVGFLNTGKARNNVTSVKHLLKRAKMLRNCPGQRHAEKLLTTGIPKRWEACELLPFCGTVWKNSEGNLRIPCIKACTSPILDATNWEFD